MTIFDTCSCAERSIKCPACCLATWNPTTPVPAPAPTDPDQQEASA